MGTATQLPECARFATVVESMMSTNRIETYAVTVFMAAGHTAGNAAFRAPRDVFTIRYAGAFRADQDCRTFSPNPAVNRSPARPS